MPWPAKGGIWCAASPAISARPLRQRSAQRARKRVDGVALELRVAGWTPHGPSRRHADASLFSSSIVSCGQAHELPAPPAGAARHQRGRARRVAELPVDAGRSSADRSAARPPPASRSGSRGRASPSRSRSRTKLFAPSQPTAKRARSSCVLPSARRASIATPSGSVRTPDRLDAALDRHARQRARALVEDPLQLRLAEHVRLGPAREAPLRVAPEPDQRLARRVAPLVHRRRHRASLERARDARALEDAPDLVIEVHRARQRIRLGPALDHAHAPAALPEQDREQLPHRPVPDDRDVDQRITPELAEGRPRAGAEVKRRPRTASAKPHRSRGRAMERRHAADPTSRSRHLPRRLRVAVEQLQHVVLAAGGTKNRRRARCRRRAARRSSLASGGAP